MKVEVIETVVTKYTFDLDRGFEGNQDDADKYVEDAIENVGLHRLTATKIESLEDDLTINGESI